MKVKIDKNKERLDIIKEDVKLFFLINRKMEFSNNNLKKL